VRDIRRWFRDAERRKSLYGGAEAAMMKTKRDMQLRKSLLESSVSAGAEDEGEAEAALAAEQAALSRVGAHRAGGAAVNHDERVVAAHRPATAQSQPQQQQQQQPVQPGADNRRAHAAAVAADPPSETVQAGGPANLRPEKESRDAMPVAGRGEQARRPGGNGDMRSAAAAAAEARLLLQQPPPPLQPQLGQVEQVVAVQPVGSVLAGEGEGGQLDGDRWSEEGDDTPPEDAFEALVWYRARAGMGDVDAMFNLGVCYEEGRGVAPSGKLACTWYQRAAVRGDADAMFSLGVCYHDGIGVEVDASRAMVNRRAGGRGGGGLGGAVVWRI